MTETQAIATRPLCIGRFLIDVPADAKVVWTSTDTHAAGEIAAPIASDERGFQRLMTRTETELRAQTHYEETTRFKEVMAPDQTSRVFVYRGDPIDTTGFQLDGYVLKGQTVFKVRGFANNDLLDRAKSRVSNGLKNIKPRDTWTIPTEPGFCFDGGFLPGGDGGFEVTGVQLTFKAYPGLMIALETQTNEQGAFAGPDLIARTEQGQGILDPGQRATMVRKDARKSVSGRVGQEVMMKRQIDGALRLVGYLQIDAEPGRTDAPSIAFSLGLTPSDNVAGRIAPDADAEVIELWDTITQSLRLRPGAV